MGFFGLAGGGEGGAAGPEGWTGVFRGVATLCTHLQKPMQHCQLARGGRGGSRIGNFGDSRER